MTRDLEVKDGVLTVYAELEYDYDVSFDRACNELVGSDYTSITIDLSRIQHITSTCIGMMAAAYILSESCHKKLSIVARGKVYTLLKMAGFGNLMTLTDSGRFTARPMESVQC